MTSTQILAIVISTVLVGIWREFRPHYAAFKARRKDAELNGTATHALKSGHIRAIEVCLLLAFFVPVGAVILIAIADGLIGNWYE